MSKIKDKNDKTALLNYSYLFKGPSLIGTQFILNYTVSQKHIPNIFNYNLKNYRILIIFGKNFPETTGHQIVV